MPEDRSPRYREIVAAARDLLERGGPEALTMRAVAEALGIRAPSLYKHLPHKEALEVAIVVDGFTEAAAAFEVATRDDPDPLAAFAQAYRTFAGRHPHVYRLMTERPLPRDSMPPGLEERTAAPLLAATGDASRARAAWAFLHGMTVLELNRRFPADGLTESAWQSGLAAFGPRSSASGRTASGEGSPA